MSAPIRVLRVIARLNVGGPSLHVSYLTKGLERFGYETMLVAGSVGPQEQSMEYVADDLGVTPVSIPELRREIYPYYDVKATRRLRRLIHEFRPDIVHTHTAKAGAVGRLAAATTDLVQRPVIVHTFHGHVLSGYFGPGWTAVFRTVERTLARRSDRLIAVSPEVRNELVAVGIAEPEKFEVIRLGLDLATRAEPKPEAGAELRRSLGIDDASVVIAWLGRMTYIKRLDVLIDAFARIRARGVDAHLVVAGEGPLRTSLEQEARDSGVGSRVHFIGVQTDVARVYSAADVVALTSANEGTPVTLIEALASGTPVVSTDVGGVRDVVRDGVTGLLVDSLDPSAVASALERIAVDGELRRSMASRAAVDVRERYSVERLLGDVDSLYRRLLAERSERAEAGSRTGSIPSTLSRDGIRPARRTLRVILLSQYFPPEVGATQSRMQAFAEYLAARGHEVTVICEFPNHPHGVIPESYRGRLIEDDRSNPYRVLRVWVKASEEKTPRSRTAFYLSYMAMASAVAPLVGRPDAVFATSPPLFTGAAGLAVSQLLRVPLVLDVRDLWPAAAVSLRQIGDGRTLQLAEWLERRLYRDAAVVTAVTRPFCEHIDEIRGRPPATVLLPNGTLDLFLHDDSEPAARAELGARDGAFLVTFAGTLGIAQALPSVLDAAALAGDVDFAFVGDGPMKQILLDQARELELRNVHFHDQAALEQMPRLLKASDALLVSLAAHPTFRSFVPSKLLDFMAVGRPVILSAAGESRRILDLSGAGVGVEPEDPEALVAAIRELASDGDARAAYGEHGRGFARTRTRLRQAERLEQVLLSLTR